MLKEFADTISEINEIEEEILSDNEMSYSEKQFWKTRIEDLKSRFCYDIE